MSREQYSNTIICAQQVDANGPSIAPVYQFLKSSAGGGISKSSSRHEHRAAKACMHYLLNQGQKNNNTCVFLSAMGRNFPLVA
ncbi:hypothetical protein CFP56_024142 [Quercus suber]|uniref:Uncharacterized protein n=1 Tax=Quercus suber TaxID=58331 RepID=A0AAW0K8F1_QUESU